MRIIILSALLLCCSGPLQAQWVPAPNPPDGVTSLTKQGNVLFAGYAGLAGTGNITKSMDEGQTWVRSDTGLDGAAVFSIFADDSILYAGTYSRGILRSGDSGKNWIPVDSMHHYSSINSFVRHGKYLYAGALDVAFGLVIKSSDNGHHWKETIKRDYLSGFVYSLVINDSFLFASA